MHCRPERWTFLKCWEQSKQNEDGADLKTPTIGPQHIWVLSGHGSACQARNRSQAVRCSTAPAAPPAPPHCSPRPAHTNHSKCFTEPVVYWLMQETSLTTWFIKKKNNNYVMLTTCSSEAQSPPGEAQISTAGTRSPWSTTAPWIWPHAGEHRGSLQSPLHQPKPHTCREAAFHQLRSKEMSFSPFPGKQKVQASPKVLPAHALGWLFQWKCL